MCYLTGKIDARTKLDSKTDLRTGFDRFSPENLAANKPIIDLLKSLTEKKNATPAQIALAWVPPRSHGLFQFLVHATRIT